MPAIFFGHGNPMNALMRNAWTDGWATIGKEIQRPKAVDRIAGRESYQSHEASRMLTFNRKVVMAVPWSLLIGFSLEVFGQENTNAIKFSLRSIDGGNITDADVRGKVVVFITTSRRLPVRAGHVASFRNLMRHYSRELSVGCLDMLVIKIQTAHRKLTVNVSVPNHPQR